MQRHLINVFTNREDAEEVETSSYMPENPYTGSLLTEVCAVLALCSHHVENFKERELIHRTLAVFQGEYRLSYTINCSED